MATATEPDIRQELDRIEASLANTHDLLEILIALRLEDAGIASSWREAVAIARDPKRAIALLEGRDG